MNLMSLLTSAVLPAIAARDPAVPVTTTNAGLTLSLTTTSTMLAAAIAGGIVVLLAIQSLSFEHIVLGIAGSIIVLAAVANLLHLVHSTNVNTKALVAATNLPQGVANA